MRHPFDGIILPEAQASEQTEEGAKQISETMDRRIWLARLLAASASVLSGSLTGQAVPPPQRPGSNPQAPPVTTQALGEEGNPPPTTKALGEEGNPPQPKGPNTPPPPGRPTTLALGEEGNPPPTTLALGEEGNPPKPIEPKPAPPGQPTTLALGEEGNPPPKKT